GMDPTGYHLTNNLLHAVNTVLVFWVAAMLLGRALPTRSWWHVDVGALLAALVFGVHPLRVESVAWVTERRDVLCALLVLATLLAYVRAATLEHARARVGWLGLAFGLYVLSMLAKIGGAPLPLVMLALDWYPLRRLRGLDVRSRLVLLEKVPFLLVAVGFAVATFFAQQDTFLAPLDRHGFGARSAQAAYALVFYVARTLWPQGLLPLYEIRLPLRPGEMRFIVSAVVVAMSALLLFAFRRRSPGLVVAGLVYVLMLSPVLGFFQNGPQLVADRYSYLPCLGWTIGAAGLGIIVLDRERVPRAARVTAVVLAVGIVGLLATLTWRQCRVWQTTASLWTYMIERDPDSGYACNGYGWVLMDRGELVEALRYFDRAIEITPQQRNPWLNRFIALGRLERLNDLRTAYEAAVVDAPPPSVRSEAHYRLGLMAEADGDRAAAVEHLDAALRLHPARAEVAEALKRLHGNADG
ncbi:MAG: tetratricopeptide repeat protein, partial [Planctomycetota bacterium]